MAYDAVQAAMASGYIKQGFTEDEAFAKAGISAADDIYYSVDGVKNSPTYGQVIKSPVATDYTEAQAAADKAKSDAARKSWEDTEVKNQNSGPVETRTTNDVVTTGGDVRVTKTTPEYADWQTKAVSANVADDAATQAAKQEYLRSQGLENAKLSEKLKAVREAEANGTNFASTANRDALGEPPKNQYTEETIKANPTGTQPPNDGSQTQDQAAKESAKGDTAGDKVANDTPPSVSGAGTAEASAQATNAGQATDQNAAANPSPASAGQPLTAEEQQKLDSKPPAAGDTASDATVDASKPAPSTQSEARTIDQTKSDVLKTITGGGKDTPTTSATTGKSQAATNQTVPAALLYNKLHDFTGYTYRISLFLLTSQDFSTLVNTPQKFVPKWTLISSGGGFPNTPTDTLTGRHPDFQEEFYFDNLTIKTIVGLNSKTKSTNAIDISFSIIEPYGMSLLDRLLSACQVTAGCPNYIDQPYLLQVDFLSNVDEENTNGAKGIVIDSKRIPIKMLELKIKPGAGGTNYNVRAMPFNHIAFSQSVAAVPVNLAVEAKTVGQYFDSTATLAALFDPDVAKQEERIDSAVNNLKDTQLSVLTTIMATGGPSNNAVIENLEVQKQRLKAELLYAATGGSFPSGYNTYFKNIAYKEGRSDHPLYQIAFNIDPIIADSPIIDPAAFNPAVATMTSKVADARAMTEKGADPNFKNVAVINVKSGTSVINVIDQVVSASEYIKKQVKSANTEAEKQTQQDTTSTDGSARQATAADTKKKPTESKPTDWYKIIPSVTLGGYDKKSQSYSKFITYSILPYKAANAYHPDFAMTKVSAKECVRTYNYFYTGKNQDILSMDIDFDATFVTGVTTYTQQAARGSSDGSSDKIIVGEKEVSPNEIASTLPKVLHPTPVDTQMAGSKASRTAEDFSVASVSRSLYSAYPRGDMLNLKLKIVGDPAFIKQDDIYNNPIQPTYGASLKTPPVSNGTAPPVNESSGQIIFDQGQVYVQIIVKGTIDIDDDLGLVNKTVTLSNGQVANGSFSGVYRVMEVESTFRGGKFEQMIDLIRYPDDLADLGKVPPANKATATGGTKSDQSLPSVIPAAGGATRPDNVPAVDTTLKAVGNGPATNPSTSNSGSGVPAAPSQPTNASTSNVNDASNNESMPQEAPALSAEKEAAKKQEALDKVNALDAKRLALEAQFTEITNKFVADKQAIKDNATLTPAEKTQKELELRLEARNSIQTTADQLKPLLLESGSTPVYYNGELTDPVRVKQLQVSADLTKFTRTIVSSRDANDTKITKLQG